MTTQEKEAAISDAIEKAGAFYAFGQKQFDEQKKDGVAYCNIFAGLVCPKETADSLIAAINKI